MKESHRYIAGERIALSQGKYTLQVQPVSMLIRSVLQGNRRKTYSQGVLQQKHIQHLFPKDLVPRETWKKLGAALTGR